MKVRKAVIGDLKRIQELSLMLFEKEIEEYDELLDMDWTFGEIGDKFFRKCLTGENTCSFVVEDKGKIVGYLVGEEVKGENYRILPKVAELDNMLVLKEYRGKGVGKMLYGAFIQWCKERGVKMIKVQASAKNKEAIAFYRKMGMEDYTLVLEGKI